MRKMSKEEELKKYKKAWEELKRSSYIRCVYNKGLGRYLHSEECSLIDSKIQELEQKYNLGSDKDVKD